MANEFRKSKLETNKEILQNLLRKRENLDLQIENLRLRIKNQEKALERKES